MTYLILSLVSFIVGLSIGIFLYLTKFIRLKKSKNLKMINHYMKFMR
jgi:ABC-type methionine transport system permease subunit